MSLETLIIDSVEKLEENLNERRQLIFSGNIRFKINICWSSSVVDIHSDGYIFTRCLYGIKYTSKLTCKAVVRSMGSHLSSFFSKSAPTSASLSTNSSQQPVDVSMPNLSAHNARSSGPLEGTTALQVNLDVYFIPYKHLVKI